jgi:proteic killer suppression protein
MEIWFTNAKTHKVFDSRKSLAKKYGDQMASRIVQRVTDLKACKTFREAFSIPGRLHPLKGGSTRNFALDLVHPYRLIIAPANEPLPFSDVEETQLNFDRIDEIEVIGVVDYH